VEGLGLVPAGDPVPLPAAATTGPTHATDPTILILAPGPDPSNEKMREGRALAPAKQEAENVGSCVQFYFTSLVGWVVCGRE